MKCPQCDGEKLYALTRGNRYRCAACRHEFTETIGTAMQSRKKPREWYDQVAALKESGLSVRQIARRMGGGCYKSVFYFLKRAEAIRKVGL